MSDANEKLDDSDEPTGSRPTGSPGLRGLYEHYATVREEILARGISEEELYADIDAAIAAVRAEKRVRKEQARLENPLP
jgi:hypothetical protein